MSDSSLKNQNTGIVFMFTGILVYSLVNLVVKNLCGHYSILEITLFRTCIATLPALFMLQKCETRARFSTPDMKRLVWLGLVNMMSVWLIFKSFALLKVSQAQTLCFTSILFVTAMSPFILKEALTPVRLIAVATGFAGVLLVAQPTGEDINLWGVFTALFFAFCDAIVLINLRIIGERNSPYKTAFFLMGFATLWGLFFYGVSAFVSETTHEILSMGWTTPSLNDLGLLLVVGLGGGLGQICVVNAFRLAPATVVSPLIYMGVVWGLVFDWLIYSNAPTFALVCGALLTIASGLMIVYEDKCPRKCAA